MEIFPLASLHDDLLSDPSTIQKTRAFIPHLRSKFESPLFSACMVQVVHDPEKRMEDGHCADRRKCKV